MNAYCANATGCVESALGHVKPTVLEQPKVRMALFPVSTSEWFAPAAADSTPTSSRDLT